MYGENPNIPPDPYSADFNESSNGIPPIVDRDIPPPRGRSRSRSPTNGYRSPYRRRSPAPAATAPKRPPHAPIAPNPSNVLGVFGLSIRTQERDLDDEFNRFGRVEKVTIVYDQRTDRSRGFGFIRMATVEDATRCIQELNGVELNGRRIRVDYSVTDRPHAATPGAYMGHRRPPRDGRGDRRERDYYDRDSRDWRDRDRDRRDRDYDRDRDRDHYPRDTWRDRDDRRRSPRRGHSPDSKDYRRRRSYSRSPPRGGSPRAAPVVPAGGYDAGVDSRW